MTTTAWVLCCDDPGDNGVEILGVYLDEVAGKRAEIEAAKTRRRDWLYLEGHPVEHDCTPLRRDGEE